MPTILDQLTLELGWDAKKFFESAKEIEKVVRDRREDFERQSKIWEFAIGNLTRLLTRLAVAFLSVEAAMRGLEMTRNLSRSGSEFANLADAIGMTVQQLSQWEQALERVGGNAREVKEAFTFQQSEFQKTQTGAGGVPSFLGYMQRLGMPDWLSYKKSDGNFDLDKFNKDYFDALQRQQNMSAAQRLEYLKGIGWGSPSSQRLFAERLREQLEATKSTNPTKENVEAFRRLNELWSELSQTAEAAQRDLVTFLQEPIAHILSSLTAILQLIRREGKEGILGELWRQFKEEGIWDFFTKPHVYDEQGRGRPVPWSEYFGGGRPSTPAAPSGGTGAAPPSSGGATTPSPGSLLRSTPPPASPQLGTPSPAEVIQQRALENPAPVETPETPAEAPPAVQNDPNFGTRLMRRNHRSSLEGLTTLPRSAMAFHAVPPGVTSTNNNTSVTIGAMTFNSRASDTAMGHAPTGIDKDLSVGSYSIHANTSLE